MITNKCGEEAALKSIYDCESAKDLHNQHRFLLKGKRQNTMKSVLVPNGKEGSMQGWDMIMDTTQKEDILLKYNEQHLQKSNISPFTHGPLHKLIGHDAHNCRILNSGLTNDEIKEIASNYGHLEDALSKVLKRLTSKLDETGKKVEFK